MVKFTWQHNLPVGSFCTFKMPSGRLDFWCSRAKNETTPPPPVTPKLKVRELSQSSFWNMWSHPTSVPSFSQISWPQLLAPGTLFRTMTLEPTIGTPQVLSTNFVPHTWGGFYFRLHPLFLKAGFHYRWSWCHNQKGRTLGSSEKGIPVPLTTPLLMIWWKVLCHRCKQ